MNGTMKINHSKPYITERHIERVSRVMKQNQIAKGAEVINFEEAICNYTGNKYAKVLDSGSKSLRIALLALKVKKGDEVILPTYVCKSVLDSVESIGAIPVLCDIEKHSWNVSYNTVVSAITENTKAIIIVHIMGIKAEIHDFKHLGIPVIEDCCQYFNSREKEACVGDIAVYSFNATKCLTTGEGGCIATNNERIYDEILRLTSARANTGMVGDMQGALGLAQLYDYSYMLSCRKKISEIYLNNIKKKRLVEKYINNSKESIHFRFLLESPANFNKCKIFFERAGIIVRKGVDDLLHNKQITNNSFPNAEYTFISTISIPIYPSLSDEEIEHVFKTINNYEDL